MDDLQEKLSTRSTDAERFRLLCDNVVDLIPVDIRRTTSYAEEGLQITRSQGNIVMEGEALDLLGEYYARSGRYVEGIAALEEAIHRFEQTGIREQQCQAGFITYNSGQRTKRSWNRQRPS